MKQVIKCSLLCIGLLCGVVTSALASSFVDKDKTMNKPSKSALLRAKKLEQSVSDLVQACNEAFRKQQPRMAMQYIEQLREMAEREHSLGSLLLLAQKYFDAQSGIDRALAYENRTEEYERLASLTWLNDQERTLLDIVRFQNYGILSQHIYLAPGRRRTSPESVWKTAEDYDSLMLALLDKLNNPNLLAYTTERLKPWHGLEGWSSTKDKAWQGSLASELFDFERERFYYHTEVNAQLLKMLKRYNHEVKSVSEQMHSAWAILETKRRKESKVYQDFVARYDSMPGSFSYMLEALKYIYEPKDNRRAHIEHLSVLKGKPSMQGLTPLQERELSEYEENLKEPEFVLLSGDITQIPSSGRVKLRLRHRFVDSCAVELYRVPGISRSPKEWRPKDGVSPLDRYTYKLKSSSEWSLSLDTLSLNALPTGYYRLVCRPIGLRGESYVSELSLAITDRVVYAPSDKSDTSRIQWLDAKTGRPVEEQTIIAWHEDKKDDKVYKYKTDHLGFINIHSDKSNLWGMSIQQEDEADPIQFLWWWNSPWSDKQETQRIDIAVQTDRGVYQEGQTVWIYGYVGEQNRHVEDARILQGLSCQVTISSPTSDKPELRTVQTDHYGRFTLEYKLPMSALLGEYHIEVKPQNRDGYGWADFRVEAYQKPTFEVKLTAPSSPLLFGDSIQIPTQVQDLTGAGLSNVQLEYELRIHKYRWRGWHLNYKSVELPRTNLVSDTKGKASLGLKLSEVGECTDTHANHCYYMYEIRLRAIAPTGETEETSLTFSVGRELAEVSFNIPEYIERSTRGRTCSFDSYSLSGEPLSQIIEYSIRPHGDTKAPILRHAEIESNKSMPLDHLIKGLPSGKYVVGYTVRGSGLKEKFSHFIIYGRKDKTIPAHTPLELFSPSENFVEGKAPEVYYTTRVKNAYVYYQVKIDDEEQEVRLLRPKAGSLERLPLDVPKSRVERIGVRMYMVEHGRVIERAIDFKRRLPERKLEIELMSFRDRTQSGGVEEIKLRITREGKPVQAALAAWLYDSALDQIAPLNLRRISVEPLLPNSFSPSRILVGRGELLDVDDTLVDLALPLEQEISGALYGARSLSPIGKMNATSAKHAVFATSEEGADSGMLKNMEHKSNIRANFSETAFFKPLLETNKKGIVGWSYRMPDNLTRWRLNLLAHTQDLSSGSRSEYIEVYRPLMVKPFLPRFLRVGDKSSIAVSLSSEEEKILSGTCSLELFELGTGASLQTYEQRFQLPSRGQIALHFSLHTPVSIDSVGVRVFARSGNLSDGEQHTLRILPNIEQTVVTQSLVHSGIGKQTFALDIFPKTGFIPDSGSIQVRIESNPLLLAIEALPTLGEVNSNNAISLSTALYVDVLSSRLLTIPNLMQWLEGRIIGSSHGIREHRDSMLLSPSSSTPWAGALAEDRELVRLQALRAYLQKIEQRGTLYDSTLINKLAKLQSSDGSWSWFPGMKPNIELTLMVMRQLIRARQLGDSEEMDRIISKGWKALHRNAEIEQASYLKEEKTSKVLPRITEWTINYLYLLSIDSKEAKCAPSSALGLFYRLLKRDAHVLPLYLKPTAAVALLPVDKALAQELIESIRQHLSQSEEGAFFANLSTRSYWWYNRDYSMTTETIEALRAIVPEDTVTVQELQRWLLEQKRGVRWESNLATAEAIYALSLGKSWEKKLEISSSRFTLVDSSDGMVKASAERPSLVRQFTKYNYPVRLEVESVGTTEKAPVWGAVSVRYAQPIERAIARGRELRAVRRYYLRTEREGKPYLEELLPEQKLRVGDVVVVRIEIAVDRAMDFVRLSDPRLACAEGRSALSGYSHSASGRLWYYVESRHEATNFYIDQLEKGEYLLEYEQSIVRPGVYQAVEAHLQSVYAPEFSASTGFGGQISVLE